MILSVESIRVYNVEFGSKTQLVDRTLYINKEEILDFAKEESIFESMNVDLTFPGEKVRIMHVVDVVQARCKLDGALDWPGVLTSEYEIAGRGRTRAVEGLGIVLCQNNTYWSRKWGSFDMFGPCADINPYAQMPQLVLEPTGEDIDFREYREALRRIGFKTSTLLANATMTSEPDHIEVFNNEVINPDLPNFTYSFQFYSKQYDTENYREPMLYGNAVADSFPLVVQPTEVLDGALSPCGGFRCITTYDLQNHPIIIELMRRHGKDLNFTGMILTVTSVEASHRDLVSKVAANILKEEFKADALVVTKGVGGASTLDVGAIASEAEKLGIVSVPIIQILNSKSNVSTECLISEQNVKSIVSSGTYYHNFHLPPADKLLGSPQDAIYLSGDDGVIAGHKIATGRPALGDVYCTTMKHVGLMSQVGNCYGMPVDY
ncbi:MAG: glycine/sarcosine/betaine reductase component B subunit [Eubacteriales bacterium]|nr:glycine/sarcosine/betaine reductase component B subunit [Eubacteriales bacterium]